jgi:SAM-dependent methyltransferase
MIGRDSCPACGAVGARLVADLPYDAPPISTYLTEFYPSLPREHFGPLTAARYRLAECPACGCIYQNPVPDDDFMASFYRLGLYGEGRPAPGPIQPYQVEHQLRELMMAMRFRQPVVPRATVLDFGTGDGGWALLAAAAGLKTNACDLSPHAFARLRLAGVVCHPSDALPENTFDFINTEQVFEHLRDPLGVIRHLARALRFEGVLKIGVPHDPALRRKLQQPDWTAPKHTPQSLNAVAPIEHLNHFEPASIDALAVRADLLPLAVVGWDLVPLSALPKYNRPGQRAVRWLRARLGERYRPLLALTQTRFFQKPAAASL